MKNKNISTLNSMIRLSRIIRNFKNARRELNQVIVQTEYFIIQGESSNTLEVKTKQSIDNTLYLELMAQLIYAVVGRQLQISTYHLEKFSQ